MIFGGQFVPGIDLVDVSLWLFTLFFFGLVFYLQAESRREGYPLETDTDGSLEDSGLNWYLPKKIFRLPHNRGDVELEHGKRDQRRHALKRAAAWPGAPYAPTGDPMRDGVGPAAYAERDDVPDLTDDGRPRIVPFRLGDGYEVAKGDPDPRGMAVVGVDGVEAGEVVDLWIDRSEAMIRYLEVKLSGGAVEKRILLPMPFALVEGKNRRVSVDAILGGQFANVPTTKKPDQVTRLEEDKISGYFGGGKLYATPSRAESFA
ncbi:MAG: photosynthetic reaction center subunit H [Parvularculaceae bacterium]